MKKKKKIPFKVLCLTSSLSLKLMILDLASFTYLEAGALPLIEAPVWLWPVP